MDTNPMEAPAEEAATATERVFAITEILEMTLLHLTQRELLSARFVSHRFNQVMQGSNNVRLMLGVVPHNLNTLLWDFHGPTASIKQAPDSATVGQYEASTQMQNGYGRHIFQVYEPNTTFFAFPSTSVPGPPPGFQPLNAAQQELCFKITTLLDHENLQKKFYRELQLSQRRLPDTIGSMRWTSPTLPSVPTQPQVSLLSNAFITSPPCKKALIKWLVKVRHAGGRERWRLKTINVAHANGLELEGVAAAVHQMMQTLTAVTVIEWELQVVPDYGIFPTEQEKQLVW